MSIGSLLNAANCVFVLFLCSADCLESSGTNNTRPRNPAWYKMKEVFKWSFATSSDDDENNSEEYAL